MACQSHFHCFLVVIIGLQNARKIASCNMALNSVISMQLIEGNVTASALHHNDVQLSLSHCFRRLGCLPLCIKVLTFQFPILNCVFGCTIGVLGSRDSMWLSLWSVMLCATRPPRFGRLPLMCKVSVIIRFFTRLGD